VFTQQRRWKQSILMKKIFYISTSNGGSPEIRNFHRKPCQTCHIFASFGRETSTRLPHVLKFLAVLHKCAHYLCNCLLKCSVFTYYLPYTLICSMC
jgi:hypothetical protein